MRPTRLASGAALALVAAMTPAAALGHAGLESSSPAAGDTLATAPSAVTLVFDGELGPDGTGFTVAGPDGVVVGEGELDLTVAERNQVSGGVEITQPGIYLVAWTVVAADGHEEEGDFVFTFASTAEPPNTAVSPADPRLPLTLGLVLLLIAVGSAAWRLLRARP